MNLRIPIYVLSAVVVLTPYAGLPYTWKAPVYIVCGIGIALLTFFDTRESH